MKPDPTKTVQISPTHSIEVGESTWNSAETSIRNRYDASGRFSRSGSSELPLDDLQPIMEAAANHDLLEPKVCALIIEALAKSIQRQ